MSRQEKSPQIKSYKEDLASYYLPRALVTFFILSAVGAPPSVSVPATLGFMMALTIEHETGK